MVRLWTILLISGAVACSVAWTVLALREKGLASLQSVRRTFRNHSRYGKAVLGFVFCGLFVLCATKPQGGGSGNGEQGTGNGGTNNVQMVNGPGGLQPLDSPGTATNPLNEGLPGEIQQPTGGGTLGDPSPVTDAWADFTPITSPNTTRTLDADDFRRGFVMTGIGTDETFDFSAPDGASVCADWQSFGAADDWTYAAFTNWEFRIGTNWIDRLRIHSDGWVETVGRRVPTPPDGALGTTRPTMRFWPFVASLGIVPQANWPMIKGNGEQGTGNGEQGAGNCQLPTTNYQLRSLFWHFVTPSNTLQMTWQNILLERTTNTPVNVQMEIWPSGRFTYRYDLKNVKCKIENGEWNAADLTNIVIGASLGETSFLMTLADVATNASFSVLHSPFYISFYPLTAEDAVDTDRDGDGLSLLDELFAFGTDPELWDTDYDGISDGDEVAAGVNPHSRDSDGDGLVDGSDPDPAVQTSLADLDGDGIPDAYEDFWFGGTNAFDTATDRDGTGFTLNGKILGGINPTNGAAAATVASTNGLVSWKLFDGFAADWPAGATNLVWERTFTVSRSSAWQQFFVSANPTNAAGWRLAGMALEWDAGDGVCGSVFASPLGDSFRIPLSTNDCPYELTLRLRATGAHSVCSPEALHFIAYAPEFHVEGGDEITGQSGAKFHVFLDGTDSQIDLVLDHSLRPCRAAMGADECDMEALSYLSGVDGDFTFSGDAYGGSVIARRPGVCPLPDIGVGDGQSVPLRSPRLMRRGGGGGGTIVVLDPSASWCCSGHGCYEDGVGYDWGGYGYYEEDDYPLDSKCLREGWYHDWGGGWIDGDCELRASSGAGDGGGYVTTSGGSVYVDGVEVWSGSPEHVYDVQCGGSGGGDGGCESCASDCADGNCDALEGSSLGSLKFRIPLGAPVTKQVSGFVWFATEEPVFIGRDTFRLLGHPSATISDTTASGVRRIVCSDRRGRDLRIEDIANGVQITIYDTAAQTLEHTWQVFNVNGSPSQVRLRKISRLNNTMSDETYTYSHSDGSWTRFDNIAGIGTQLTVDNYLDIGGLKRETRTTTDGAGNILESVTTEMSLVGEFDNAVLRETYRSESTGLGTEWTETDYWNDPPNFARHGKPRLVRGNARAWTYSDYDENGHLTLRITQRGNAAVPSGFPYVVSNVLYDAGVLTDAFVTVWDFAPHNGDSCHEDDAARPRTETRYVVKDGAATVVGRTWIRYTRLYRDAHAAIKKETWRAGTQGDEMGDGSNAYSYEITYADTDDYTPLLMRNAAAETLDEDGILTVNAYLLSGDVLFCTTRRYLASNQFHTYETTERDASYGTVLRRTVRLTDGDTIIEDEQSIYDSQNRLRSTTYLDGTSLTNAYSCCRLLWKRDREGRKVLRSAQTGTDHLYNAMEDVWLSDISTNGQYRVTQHFYDALGRETNTVTYAGTTPGEASVPSYPSQSSQMSQTTTIYPNGGNAYAIHTDERGKVTISRTDILGGCLESGEAVFTNGVEVVKTKSRSYFGGGSSTRREWDGDKFTEERRFDEYGQDGRRVAYAVTESHDCGTVTNSISTYDFLGRLVSSAVRGANGSTIVTANTYDGATARILSAATTGSPVVTYGYNERGERASTSQDGTTILNATSYETISQQIYRVATTVRMTGSVTNSVQIRKVQLTGLSDALRSRTVAVAESGRETVTESSFDAESGILTSVSQTEADTPQTMRSVCGMMLDLTSIDGAREMSYDAFGRNAAIAASNASGVTNRFDCMEYDQSGNIVRYVTDLRDGRVAESLTEYDMLNRVVGQTDALDQDTETGYDALDRKVSTSGDTYPLCFGYDSFGRKTTGHTTRDGGVTWDVTQWAYDPASGVNVSKTYADGSQIAYAYTDNGNKTRTTWARGAWKQNAYNARNLVSGTTYSEAGTPSVAYAYEDSGNVASATLSDGTAYAYGYDDRLLNTNESVVVGGEAFALNRTFDGFRRELETSVIITNVAYSAKVRSYDSENRICGYAFTNAAGRGMSVTLAYDGSYLTNMTYALPGGVLFSAELTRESGRKELVTRRDYVFGGQSTFWYSTEYDLLGRPTNATDSVSLVREWLYNRRSELATASIGTNLYAYAYDSIGNRLWSAENAATNAYTANSLNQYTSVASSTNLVYDADGNLTNDGIFSYSYDAENRLVAAYPLSPVVGSLAVLNRYDHKHRRVQQIVKHYDGTTWGTIETHTFVWDGNNIVLEKIAFANGTTRMCEYFWGMDKSGTEQGAGGVEGLLAVSIDGVFYIPCYDHNGNIFLYVSENGSIAAQYTYDPYGNITDMSGALATQFSFGFSTKYHDREIGLVSYQRRFYRPDLGRWLNRDPIEERGGENLYAFCNNAPMFYIDLQGEHPAILIPAGAAVAAAALEAAAETAAVALAAAAGAIAGELLKRSCKRCRPCDPPVGTEMYKIEYGHAHAGHDPHIHYFTVQQSPPFAGCGCFAPRTDLGGGDIPKAGTIPYRKPSGGGIFQ